MVIFSLLTIIFSCFLLFGGLMLALRFALPADIAVPRLKLVLVLVAVWLILTAVFGYLGYFNWERPLLAIAAGVLPIALALFLASVARGHIIRAMPVGVQLVLQGLRLVVGLALAVKGGMGAADWTLIGIGLLEMVFGVGGLIMWQLTFNRKAYSLSALLNWQVSSAITAGISLFGLMAVGMGLVPGDAPFFMAFPGVWLVSFFYPALIWVMTVTTRKLRKHGLHFNTEREQDPSAGPPSREA